MEVWALPRDGGLFAGEEAVYSFRSYLSAGRST